MGTECQQVALSAVSWPHALPAPWGAPGGATALPALPGAHWQPRCRCSCDTLSVGGQIWLFKVLL